MLPCDIDTNCDTLKECVHSIKFKNNQIESAKCKKVSTKEIVNEQKNMSSENKSLLKNTLKHFDTLFDRMLGTHKCNAMSLKLKPNTFLKHHKPHPMPLKCYDKVKEEIDRLEELDIIEKDLNAKHAAPCFIRPKADNTMRFLTDFRELNSNLERNPFPLPRIDEMLQSLGKFTCAIKLNLNMGHYHFLLNDLAKSLTTISLPWGNYHCNRLPIGIIIAVDTFQQEMSMLFHDIPFVKTHLDDILIVSCNNATDHLDKLAQVSQRLLEANLKVKMQKCEFL